MVAIYFYFDNDGSCKEFCDEILSGVYSELKGRGEPFEVVLIFYGREEDYEEQTRDMPWLLLPFGDASGPRLLAYFDEASSSSLVVLGADGKVLGQNMQETVGEYGARGYPFSPERIAEAKREMLDDLTLESLLVHGDLDYVLGKHGSKVPVKDLLGKTVLIYYKAQSDDDFTSMLVDIYEELRSSQCEVEVIFGYEGDDRSLFDKGWSRMPWLALPFGDERQSFIPRQLKRKTTFSGPIFAVIGPSGRTITKDAVDLLVTYRAKAFPFSDEHIQKLQQEERHYGSDGVGYITDYKSFLLSRTDYLVRNNGDHVNSAEALDGKTIGVYFANLSRGCREFTATLADAYSEIKAAGGDFEVVFVRKYMDEDSSRMCFSGMPWLAVPFTPWRDEHWWQSMYDAFLQPRVPHLAIVDGRSGEMVLDPFCELEARGLVEEYGADAFPFTPERAAELQQRKEDAKKNQTVTSVLASATRDFVLTADGTKVPVLELEGKMVAIFFYNNDDDMCWKLSPILSDVYSELKGRGEPFEVVALFYNGEEDEYEAQTMGMPWLRFPFRDQSAPRLRRYFSGCGSLVLLGADGKIVSENLQEIVQDYGARGYPFSSERIAEVEREVEEEQTLESLLVHGDLDYVLAKDGSKVPVRDLVGKTILIYYTSYLYVLFASVVVAVYEELRSKQCEVEAIFVSEDEELGLYARSYESVPIPWLALPFGDERRSLLYRKLKLYNATGSHSPVLVAIDPSGRTLRTDAYNLVKRYGAEAFPFTDEHIKKLQPEEEEGDDDDDDGDVNITDCKSFLLSQTDYLVRNNGDQVNAAEALEGKTIGIYNVDTYRECREFTLTLAEAYNEIKAAGGDFEVVFVQRYMDENTFREFISGTPWLSVPFMPWRTAERWWNRMYRLAGQRGVPDLVIVDGRSGEVVSESLDARDLVEEYGADAFPFTPERAAELQRRKEDAKKNQTVTSVLASATRDFLLSPDGTKVPVSELEGKMVVIFFYESYYESGSKLSSILTGVYSELKGRGEPFEVVALFFNGEEDEYEAKTKGMPWLRFPFRDQSALRLIRYFYGWDLRGTLLLLGVDGKTVNDNLQAIVWEYGARAYPFSPERIEEVKRQIRDEQTLESLLVYDDLDYVLGKDGAKIPVKDLVGKMVLFLFSAYHFSARAFVRRLVDVYEELRSKRCQVEVIFLSSDQDLDSFDMSYSEMPWLALPYGDARQSSIANKLKLDIAYIPILAVIDPSGRTVRTDGEYYVEKYGAEAFPFTDEHIEKLQQEKD